MKITILLLVFVIFGLSTGNANSVEAPADVAAPPQDAVCVASGLCSKVLTEGTGDVHPDAWDEVTVHYSGWTTDGKMFDSSVTRGQMATFPLNRVIPGWTEGLQLMVVGEKRRFWIPKELAYNDMPGRPAGMLVFDVELFSIQDKPAPPPPPPVPEDVTGPPADAEVTASGLASKVLRPGVGTAHPTARSTVTAHYSGWTTDGKMFDSSVVRGEAVAFPLNRVIPGWTEGLQLMVVGEKRRFWIPEELAYKGQAGAPQGMLVFDVELVSFE
jgi:peptidylprolyl isomerase